MSLSNEQVWSLICPYLPHSQLLKLSLVSKQTSHAALNCIYKSPTFGIGFKYDPLDSFNAFLSNSMFTLSRVKVIQLQNVQETVYERVKENWLQILMSLPHLQVLDFNGVEFLNNSHVSRISTPCVPCHTLNLSRTSNLNVQNALNFLSCFPFLLDLKLDYSSLLSNNAFLQALPMIVPHLEALSFAEATWTKQGLELAFKDGGFSRLKGLRLDQCGQLNDECLHILAESSSPLTRLEIPKCIGITGTGIIGLAKGKPYLTHLDLSFIPLTALTLDMLCTVMSQLRFLTFFGISFTPIDRIKHKGSILKAFDSLDSLETLILTDITDKTPHNVIWRIGESIQKLNSFILFRKEYNREHILGYYADVDENQLIVDTAFVNKFNQHSQYVWHRPCRMSLYVQESS